MLNMTNVTYRPHYQMMDGVRFPAMFSSDCFRQALAYKPKPEDVIIATYPKCGTTWMQNIALYIFRKGKELENHGDFFAMCPFIDALGSQGMEGMPRPGAFKTHLPYHHVPYSPEAKYIYILRNPKDCCTSMYYHTKMNVGLGYWEAKFDDFFELFMAGEVEYNDYFDHLASWYPHINDTNVFFTTYEAMKEETKSVVLKLAEFLGEDYIEAIRADKNVLSNILQFSSFEYMKRHISELYDSKLVPQEALEDPGMLEGIRHMVKYGRSLDPPDMEERLQFVRKGVVGDWKNHLSEEQSGRLSEKFLERTCGMDEIREMYKDFI